MALEEITIPEGVETIGQQAFYACQNLSKLELPSSLSEIGMGAFYYNNALTEITCNAITPPDCDTMAFDNSIYESCKLYVPEESIEAYKTTNPWSNFFEINAGVEELFDAPQSSWNVYNMSGLKVMTTSNAADINNLPAGIYIINGKKVMIGK